MKQQVDSISRHLEQSGLAVVHMLGAFKVVVRPAFEGPHPETGELIERPERKLVVMNVHPWLRNELNPHDLRPVPDLKPGTLAAPEIVHAVLEGLKANREVNVEALGRFRLSTRGDASVPAFHASAALLTRVN